MFLMNMTPEMGVRYGGNTVGAQKQTRSMIQNRHVSHEFLASGPGSTSSMGIHARREKKTTPLERVDTTMMETRILKEVLLPSTEKILCYRCRMTLGGYLADVQCGK